MPVYGESYNSKHEGQGKDYFSNDNFLDIPGKSENQNMGKKMINKNLSRKLSAISDMLDEDDEASHANWRQKQRKNSGGFSDSSGRDDNSDDGSSF